MLIVSELAAPAADVGGEEVPGVHVARAAQVADGHVAGAGLQQHVARLDVAVRDAQRVEVLQARRELEAEGGQLGLGPAFLGGGPAVDLLVECGGLNVNHGK